MKSIVIDTNGFLRMLLNDIPEQADQIETLIRKAKAEKLQIVVPQIIIFEISFILEKYYVIEKQEVIEKLKSLITSPYFVIESREIFNKALTVYSKNTISFVDCFLFAKANLEDLELFTFDKKLQKLES